ncbi:heavy metal resistance protein [Sphingomonas oleivorans]|uniref:Heavy metal resistance protein n=1 Tax=Sphingomonas oleivorans TaxID=1735121 RepID=A0A2T5FZV9_9SPHN|nr:periplasmic heavy metal sensor [Sphingomonas oleivorans]PTQ12239.1 heavy metal resistance protein [Sphingomonas oleivorans]
MSAMARTWLMIAAAFLAAFAGVLVGRGLLQDRPSPGVELHDLLHEKLDLNPAQHARLDMIERRFAVRKRVLELELRTSNAALADAIEAEHGYGPRVRAAVDRSHLAMGQLQKETLAHVFAMRQILLPDQAAIFDRAVVRALTDDGR